MLGIWLAKMLRTCTSRRYAVNKSRMIPLANTAGTAAHACARSPPSATRAQPRHAQFFRKQPSSMAPPAPCGAETIRRGRMRCSIAMAVSPARARARPMKPRSPAACGGCRGLAGGLPLFTHALGPLLRKRRRAVSFETNHRGPDERTRQGSQALPEGAVVFGADAYVVALAQLSPRLLRPRAGRSRPYPSRATRPRADCHPSIPRRCRRLMDESTRWRSRGSSESHPFGATAEVSGYSSISFALAATLEPSADRLFPAAAIRPRAHVLERLRPMTPDGPPVIGETLATSISTPVHGTLGWTMALRSARACGFASRAASPRSIPPHSP